jgi:hypothetical protein
MFRRAASPRRSLSISRACGCRVSENENDAEEMPHEGAQQHNKASNTQAGPAEQALDNPQRRPADLSSGQRSSVAYSLANCSGVSSP